MKYLDEQAFRGYVTLLCIDDVREPLVMEFADGPVCVADKGYMWLQHFPQGANYTITANFNAQGEIVRWYVDMCKPYFLDQDGVLWFDDLYLDLDISPSWAIELLDVEELDEALAQGEVTSLEYEIAWREANRVITAIEEDRFPLLLMGETHRDLLLQMLS